MFKTLVYMLGATAILHLIMALTMGTPHDMYLLYVSVFVGAIVITALAES